MASKGRRNRIATLEHLEARILRTSAVLVGTGPEPLGPAAEIDQLISAELDRPSGGPPTLIATFPGFLASDARLTEVRGVAIDPDGFVVVLGRGPAPNDPETQIGKVVRVEPESGDRRLITVLSAEFPASLEPQRLTGLQDVAVGPEGTIFVLGEGPDPADPATEIVKVVRVDPMTGARVLVAGFAGRLAMGTRLTRAAGIAVEPDGEILVVGTGPKSTDPVDQVVKVVRVDPASGDMVLVAASRDEIAAQERLDRVQGIAVDEEGTIFVLGTGAAPSDPGAEVPKLVRIDPVSGVQRLVAGLSGPLTTEDRLAEIVSLASGPDGALYVAGSGSSPTDPGAEVVRIIRVEPETGARSVVLEFPDRPTRSVRLLEVDDLAIGMLRQADGMGHDRGGESPPAHPEGRRSRFQPPGRPGRGLRIAPRIVPPGRRDLSPSRLLNHPLRVVERRPGSLRPGAIRPGGLRPRSRDDAHLPPFALSGRGPSGIVRPLPPTLLRLVDRLARPRPQGWSS